MALFRGFFKKIGVPLFFLTSYSRFFWPLCLAFGVGLLGLAFSFPVQAGGPLKTNINGVPFRWQDTVTYNFEGGALKPGVYDRESSRQMIVAAFQTWSEIPGIDLLLQEGPDLPDGGDTRAENFQDFYGTGATACYDDDPETPCYSPIIFDEDGSILESMFGECAQFSVLGFAGFMDIAGNNPDPALTAVKKGQAIFSGACIAPALQKPGCPPCVQVLESEAEVKALFLHEIGHWLGMDHAQVNPQSSLSCRQGEVCSDSLLQDIPTMFPLLFRGDAQLSLHRDDVTYFQKLYRANSVSSCSVQGRVVSVDTGEELRGVEVVARNINPDLSRIDALGSLSGVEAPRLTLKGKEPDNCLEDCGKFEITGLMPGESYQICVQRILEDFMGNRSVGPVDPPFQGVDNFCEDEIVHCECVGDQCLSLNDLKIMAKNSGLDDQALFVPAETEEKKVSSGCALSSRFSAEKNGWSMFSNGLPWFFVMFLLPHFFSVSFHREK